MRFIISAILILIITFSLSTLPINQSIDNFDFSFFTNQENELEENPAEESVEVSYKLESDINEQHIFEDSFKIDVLSNTNNSLEAVEEKMAFEILRNDEVIETINIGNNSSSTEIQELSETEFKKTITFNLNNLNLTSGYYNYKISLDDQEINVSHTITKDKEYIGSSERAGEGVQYTRVYYVDENYMYLVPVARKISESGITIRNTVNLLIDPPAEEMGLSTEPAAPRIPRVYVSNGTARVDLDSNDLEPFNQGSSAAYFAIDSMVKTLQEFSIIDRVKFFVDDSDQGSYFHGTDLTTYFEEEDKPKAYVGLETSKNYMYLYPIEIEAEQLTDKVNAIFKTLSNGQYNESMNSQLFGTLPPTVELLDFKFNERTIQLDLSEAFLDAYDNDQYNQLMYESMLYSFTSIEGFDSVSILVEGEEVTDFLGNNISEPTEPNRYLNTLD